MLSSLRAWYLRTFLPFEAQEHPLHTPTFCDEIADLVDAEMGVGDEVRPMYRGSMIVHTRDWYAEHEPQLDWDSLPRS